MVRKTLNSALEEKNYEKVILLLTNAKDYFYSYLNEGGTGKFIKKFYFYREVSPNEGYFELMSQLMENSFEIAVWEIMEKWDGRGDAFAFFWSFLPKRLGHMYRKMYKEEVRQETIGEFIWEDEIEEKD